MVKMFISFLKTLLHFKSYVIWSNIKRNKDNTIDRNKRNMREQNSNDALSWIRFTDFIKLEHIISIEITMLLEVLYLH